MPSTFLRNIGDNDTHRSMTYSLVFRYPVILSFENHCSIKGQQRMAELLQEIFGGIGIQV